MFHSSDTQPLLPNARTITETGAIQGLDQISWITHGGGPGGNDLLVDQINFASTDVPEPPTLALLSLGVVTLALVRRRVPDFP